jgi:hypothetical protein
MPRFFFHVRDGDVLTEDPDGSEFPDLAVALAEALAAARDVLAEQLKAGANPDGQRFEIHDDAGRMLGAVPFSDALKPI